VSTARRATGAAHGRFQPFHHGHLEYVLAAKSRCEFLFVGITNPDPEFDAVSTVNRRRSDPAANPFSYHERRLMIEGSLLDAGVPRHEFEVVPFPINTPWRIRHYIAATTRHYVTIYDQWGIEKVRLLESAGLDVEVLWTRDESQRFTSGLRIRQLLASDGNWRPFVPAHVAAIIIRNELAQKVKELEI
jgi:cytidyltransferase-like protein